RLTATGTTIHVGRTTATAEGRVVDEQGRLVAHATTTCVILRARA
ncbi:PaaI family thioesterase, partial [Nocardia gipuzkoensis]